MSGKFLLDTNVVIAFLAGELAIRQLLAEAEDVFVPIIALGELYFGARKSGQVEKNLTRINEFVINCSILVCDTDTAREYGIIKNTLRAKGRPIPENDIWIAAVAKQHGLTLVTRNLHFSEIQSLNIETR